MSEMVDHFRGIHISRTGWAWERKKLERYGYWVDGGIWPRLRFVRNSTLEDYIYGDLRPTKPMGLAAILTHPVQSSQTPPAQAPEQQ